MVPEFSRSARGVEVWAALKSLGREGVVALVEECCDHASAFAAGLREIGYDILNDVVINQVVASLPGFEDRSGEIAARVQASGECWLGPTLWQGRKGLHVSVSSWATTEEDVERALTAIKRVTAEVIGRTA